MGLYLRDGWLHPDAGCLNAKFVFDCEPGARGGEECYLALVRWRVPAEDQAGDQGGWIDLCVVQRRGRCG